MISIEIDDAVIEARMSAAGYAPPGASYHIAAHPKVEGICDACGGTLTVRQDDVPGACTGAYYHQQTEALKDFYEKSSANSGLWRETSPLRT